MLSLTKLHMKPKIKSLNDALAFLLEGLYYAETKLSDEFPACCGKINSPRLHDVVNNYTGSTQNKLLKLDRVFNYLMKDPEHRVNKVVDELITETRLMLSSAVSENLKDLLTVGCIQNINAYKIASYRSAYLMAVELELDTATDLLQQVLEWEVETSRALARLSIEEFNQSEKVNY
jgi:ferritin-like metal-binding protein YciE